MSEKKQKYAYWMRPSMVAEIEKMLAEANATSKGDFVCRAVEFYIGYLRQQKNINYLAPMLAGAIKGEVRSLGKDWCRGTSLSWLRLRKLTSVTCNGMEHFITPRTIRICTSGIL